MPYDEADETDPLILVGVELPGGEEAARDLARVFAEEFARLGYGEEALMRLFTDPFYSGAHRTLLVLGEEAVREIVRESTHVWGGIRFRDEEPAPDAGSGLLSVRDFRTLREGGPGDA
jgi:hypothetical protein